MDIWIEQQDAIRRAITEVDVEPIADVDFDVSVGVAVPSTIALQPLPSRIIEIVPDYEDYLFFLLANERIVIADPDNLQIVLVIAAEALCPLTFNHAGQVALASSDYPEPRRDLRQHFPRGGCRA